MNNTTPTNLAWLSLHVYYRHDLGLLLVNVIDPMLQQWYKQGLIANHFFIRYWEGGPHIRLRLKTSVEATGRFAPDLTNHYENMLESTVDYDPDFRIVRSYYVQEPERFGGLSSMPMAESLFESSSRQVMEILKMHKDSWSYSLAISYALQMHLLFLKRFGTKLEVAVQLLDFMFELYIKFALKRPFENGLRNELARVNHFFERSFLSQANEINFLCAGIWNQTAWEETNWRAQWSYAIQSMVHKFNFFMLAFNDSGAGFGTDIKGSWPQKEVLYQWFQLSSYFHLTNNRLGIHLRDESFIYYCLKKGLSAISIQRHSECQSYVSADSETVMSHNIL